MPGYKIEFSNGNPKTFAICIQRFFLDEKHAVETCGILAESFRCEQFVLTEYVALPAPRKEDAP